jgi:flavorubredoxin
VQRAELGRITELFDGVFALSHLVDLARPRTWVDPTATGFDPSNSYLILSGGEALLIDTGFRAHGDALIEQISALLPADTPLHVVTTRIEPDALGNVDRVVAGFPVKRLLGQTNVKPLDYLGPLSHRYPELEFDNGLRPGDTFSFGEERTITVVEPAVRTLPTMWLWDEMSGILFTSDSFGGLHVQDEEWDGEALEDTQHLERHLLAKFDWLAIADTTLAVQRLDRAASLDPLSALAPGHGRWTVGAEAVRLRIDVLREALRAIPSITRGAGNAGAET